MTDEVKTLTQRDVYYLYERYGGYLDAAGRSKIDNLLQRMEYAEQEVQDAQADAGDKLYFSACAEIEKLRAKDEAGAEPRPPVDDAPRKTRGDRAREAVAEGREVARAWGDMVKRAKENAK